MSAASVSTVGEHTTGSSVGPFGGQSYLDSGVVVLAGEAASSGCVSEALRAQPLRSARAVEAVTSRSRRFIGLNGFCGEEKFGVAKRPV